MPLHALRGLAAPHARTLFLPRGHYTAEPARVVVLQRGASPTADIYLRPRLDGSTVPHLWWDMLHGPPPLAAGDYVIIVRYASRPVLDALEAAAPTLAGVVYLMDDDLPGAPADRSLPLDYRIRLARAYGTIAGPLSALCSEIWVCSRALADRYPASSCQVIEPLPVAATTPTPPVRVVYHATGSHRGDQHWLRDVIARVQGERADILVELTGGSAIARLFSRVPRCRVLHPMPWPTYLLYAQSMQFDIGLAPLWNNPFNLARSYNKILDIARVGAAGIFADRPPFNDLIKHEQTGLLAGDSPAAWVEAIHRLADDAALRQRLAAAVRSLCDSLPRRAATPGRLTWVMTMLGRD